MNGIHYALIATALIVILLVFGGTDCESSCSRETRQESSSCTGYNCDAGYIAPGVKSLDYYSTYPRIQQNEIINDAMFDDDEGSW